MLFEIQMYGGLSTMSTFKKSAVVEALSPGPSRICAIVENSCENEQTYCINVDIKSQQNCGGDGDRIA